MNINTENTSTENRFNLIDEPWIPIVDAGRVSLKQIFSNPNYRALGGNPVQKIALTKLLLAIAQAAYTPDDDEDWAALGTDGMGQKCLDYLEKWHDRFYLYGEKPFLQMREIAKFKLQPMAALSPSIATGNPTILTQTQIAKPFSDADWMLTLLVDQNFSVKHYLAYAAKTQPNKKGKGKATKSGPALGPTSYLHNFLQSRTILQTIWLNQLSIDNINSLPFEHKVEQSRPVWELNISDRDSPEAKVVQNSYLGRLCPLSRFISYISGNKIKYGEGIIYPSHLENAIEISVAFGRKKEKFYAINVNPNKRPWRELSALLSFFNAGSNSIDCLQLKFSLSSEIRMRKICELYDDFSIWSGGVLLSGDSNSQFSHGEDDYVESTVTLSTESLGKIWYEQLKHEMSELDDLEEKMKNAVYNYHCREIKKDDKQKKTKGKRDKRADALKESASHLYWQLCERKFQELVNACGIEELEERKNTLKKMRGYFASCIYKAYDTVCPKETARQLDAWAKCRPNLSKYSLSASS